MGRPGMAEPWGWERAGVRDPARGPWGRGVLGCQTGGAVPPAVRMLKYSVKPVCGDAVWGTRGW